jgi:DNA-binding SARP family transcriptional activator
VIAGADETSLPSVHGGGKSETTTRLRTVAAPRFGGFDCRLGSGKTLLVEFRILGPLEVLDVGGPVALGRLKERIVLAVLLLHPNEFVSRERLIDELWGESPPPTARKAVNVYLSQLRKTLARHGDSPIATASGGYRLTVDPDRLDVARVQRLLAAARECTSTGALEEAVRLFRETLALWRGPTLAGLRLESHGRNEVAQLDELRLTALLERIDCDLALGRQEDVIGELEVLVSEHPLRERIRAQQMLALYRADRQAEALDAYQQARSVLVEELGIEPSPALQRLQQGILRQDPALETPSGIPASRERADDRVVAAQVRVRQSHERERIEPKRKTVTALVCDLAGLVGSERDLDFEARGQRMAPILAEVSGVLELHGGRLQPLVGDALLAVFGHPVIHEDDSLRAVRAAAEVLKRLAELEGKSGGRAPLDLAVGIGIDTGMALVGSEATDQSLAASVAVRVATRLAQAAQAGEVLLGEPTVKLVDKAVTVEQAEPFKMKGRSEPVAAYRLLAVQSAKRGSRGKPRRHELFVGRAAELSLLGKVWNGVQAERQCELVTVVGEAGIGKSRLAEEFLSGAKATVVASRCLNYGEGVTYWPVVEVVKQLGVRPANDAAAAAIGSLVGARAATASAEEIAWAFRKLLEEVASERPLVCLFDDVQWGDETFLDLIEHVGLLSSGASFLLLCLARSEFAERRAGWPITIRLDPLDTAEVDQLIPATIGAELRGQITRFAAGNPLFVEEMVAMAGEAEGNVSVPPSLHALLAARIDRLDRHERRILECAAVEGEVFHRGAVEALAEDEEQATGRLATLVRKELIRPHEPQLAGEDGFRFRHVLIRDAAYEAITKATRAKLHQRFAAWLDDRRSGVTDLDEIVGHHLEQAARYKDELGEPDAELGSRAGKRLAAAGRRARAQRNAAAVGLLSRALSLLSPQPELRGPLLIELALALGYSRDYRAEIEQLDEAIELAQERDDRGTASWGSILRSFTKMHIDREYSAQHGLFEARRALDIFAQLGDARGQAFSWGLAAYCHWFRGEHVQQRAAAERALEFATLAGDEALQARSRYAAVAAAMFGATPLADVTTELEQLLGASGWRSDDYHLLLAQVYAMQSRWREARSAAGAGVAWLRERGNEFDATVSGGAALGALELLAGDPAAAERHLAPCLELLQQRGEILFSSSVAADLGAAMVAQGRCKEALRYAHISRRSGAPDHCVPQVQWRAVRARVLARTDRAAEAQKVALEAVTHAKQTDNVNLQAHAYAALAEVLRLGERQTEAAVAAENALTLYSGKGNIAAAESLGRSVHG